MVSGKAEQAHADADALAELAAGACGGSVRRLIVPGAGPLAVLDEVRMIDRFRRHDCGGVTPKSWCPDHGTVAGRATEDHIEGGIYCTQRAASRPRHPARA
ncbi:MULTISPECIES: hypothetical protein [unclassified Streptomyces]|uniref:hypothetical protein n=1 Tax=unclassified Streptomyces TaxID=2593676 RepID=UPI002E2D3467|nr:MULTISPECIES: hypothetical protein [unclassified Streptomyces]